MLQNDYFVSKLELISNKKGSRGIKRPPRTADLNETEDRKGVLTEGRCHQH